MTVLLVNLDPTLEGNFGYAFFNVLNANDIGVHSFSLSVKISFGDFILTGILGWGFL
jgi:hypothetical protein